jgi:uncharacterized protein with LGFP repeats
LASQLSGLEVPGQKPRDEAPGDPQATSDSNGDKWFKPNLWWLLALVPVVILIGAVALVFTLRRRRTDDPFARDDSFAMQDVRFSGDADAAYGTGGAPERVTTDDEYAAAMFGDRYTSGRLGSLPRAGDDLTPDVAPKDEDLWGAPSSISSISEHTEQNDEATASEDDPATEAVPASEAEPDQSGEDDDPDTVDTAPTRIQTAESAIAAAAAAAAIKRDSVTDTGRHARVEIDEEPPAQRVAFLVPLDNPNEAPEGYPIKANTKSGVYWAPGNPSYHDASAEIWFASEELARVNGFITEAESH